MVFLFKMVEITFSDKSPDRLSAEERSGKSTFGLPPGIPPSCRFSAKPHLVGNIPTLYPTYCGDKKNFQKSYTNDIPRVIAGKNPRLCCKNHNLFAAVNKKISAIF
jgi:hypothetical protein